MNHGDNTLIKVTYEIVLFDRISSPDINENKKNLVDILTENNQVLENKLTYLNTLRLKHQPYTLIKISSEASTYRSQNIG